MKRINLISNKLRIATVVILTAGICTAMPMISMASSWKDVVSFTKNIDEVGDYSGYFTDGSFAFGNYYEDIAFETLKSQGIDVSSTEEAYTCYTNICDQWRNTSMTVDELNTRVCNVYAGEDASVLQAIAQSIMVMPKAADAYTNPYNNDGYTYIDPSTLDGAFAFGSDYNYGENPG
ncbi:hypothetical protein [Oribacterium sp. FC2011]|uniref:hypothetical protein n=1 Tax=Oribacterium sp. FC2011 TaxID=1408311 RepID=UPI0004E10937|nr:hypothetical protein [Oribacterium sp. FC2011]